jgi:hypothetical protein
VAERSDEKNSMSILQGHRIAAGNCKEKWIVEMRGIDFMNEYRRQHSRCESRSTRA